MKYSWQEFNFQNHIFESYLNQEFLLKNGISYFFELKKSSYFHANTHVELARG